jgi:predicted dehydrogenase
MEESINVGVLGAGYWGRKVISEYLQLEKTNAKVHLAKVCDLKDDNLNLLQGKPALRKGEIELRVH